MTNNIVINEAKDIDNIINKIATQQYVSFDCETTGLNFCTDKLHGISIATAKEEWYVCDEALRPFIDKISILSKDNNISWIGFNTPFDLHFLYPYGFFPTNLLDAQMAAHLIDENQSMKLKEQSKLRIGYDGEILEFKDLQKLYKKDLGKKRMDQVSIYDIPIDILGKYAALDARLTYNLMMHLFYLLDQEGMTKIFYEIEMPFIKVLWRMEHNGFWLSLDRLKKLETEFTKEYENALDSWSTITNNLNPRSQPQVSGFFYDTLGYKTGLKTKKGKDAVDVIALIRLSKMDKTGAAATLLKLRQFDKLLSTYILPFQEKIYNNRIYGSFNRTGTVTGRLASSDPNLQNISIRTDMGKKVRTAFSAPPGYKLLVVDYSQLEMRIAAHFSKDPRLMQIFAENGDVHNLTADLIKCDRYIAKTINYQKFYGSGPRAVANTIEKETHDRPQEKDIKEFMNRWDNSYSGVVNWSKRVLSYARSHKYVPTLVGRRRRLPDIAAYDNQLRSSAERQAINAPVQGSAADVIEYPMVKLESYLNWFDSKLVAQVHDELVIEAPEDGIDELSIYVKKIMEEVEEYFDIRVPIIAEPHSGSTWAEAK